MEVLDYIIKELLKRKVATKKELAQIKRQAAKKFGVKFPTDPDILIRYFELVKVKKIKKSKQLEELLAKREIRGLSGVAVITALTKPWPCPGKCIFCPNEVRMPKSYLAREPAAQRALRNKYDPYKQITSRIKVLQGCGHLTEKIDLIILGGTWSFYPKRYQTYFIKRLFDSANQKTARSLKEAQRINEKAKNRIIGITIETRPDYINIDEIKQLRKLGVTRVEIGAQSVYDGVLILNQRDHTTKEVI